MRLAFVFIMTALFAVSCSPTGGKSPVIVNGRQIDMTWGQRIYERNCAACHDDGSNGAQVIGDRNGWKSRIAKGVPELVGNAIRGYSGALGFMPPRGGNPALSHEDVTAATWYIVTRSR